MRVAFYSSARTFDEPGTNTHFGTSTRYTNTEQRGIVDCSMYTLPADSRPANTAALLAQSRFSRS